MSFNPYMQPFSDEQIAAVQQIANGVYNSKKMTTVWWKPETEQYFLANNPHSEEPDYGIAITKPHEIVRARSQIAKMGGAAMLDSNELDKYTYGYITNEFLTQAVGLNHSLAKLQKQYENTGDESALMSGGTITAQDYPALVDVMIDTSVEEIVVKDFVILQAIPRKPWDKLTYTFDSKTPFRNTYRLGELDVADSRSVSYGRGSINLMKAEGRVSLSIWVKLAIRQHDIEGDNTSMIDQDWDRGFSEELSTTLQGFTNQAAAGAYDVLAGGAFYHTTNPLVRIETDTLSIRAAGGEADTLIMNSKTFRIFTDNAWIRDNSSTIFGTTPNFDKRKSRVATVNKLPGFTVYIDEVVPTGSIIILDGNKAAVWLDGPRSNRIVESNYGNIVDTIHDRWYGSGIKFAGMGVEETGTTT